jgi:hypothetical protein
LFPKADSKVPLLDTDSDTHEVELLSPNSMHPSPTNDDASPTDEHAPEPADLDSSSSWWQKHCSRDGRIFRVVYGKVKQVS